MAAPNINPIAKVISKGWSMQKTSILNLNSLIRFSMVNELSVVCRQN